MGYQHILWSEADGVATLTINRPERLNALQGEVCGEMIDALDRIRDGLSGARCLLLTGAGRAFSSGADLAQGVIGQEQDRPFDIGKSLDAYFNPLIERLFALPVPVVTAVNGPAAGAGCSLALAGDVIVAARSAYFLQAFVNIGLVPDVGSTWLLPRLVGRARAMRMMLLGERISAEQAVDWGLASFLAEDDALAAEAGAIAAKLANGPTRALAMVRHGVQTALHGSFTDTLAMERRNQQAAGRTADFAEGVAAFLQKRKADFTGK